MFSSEQLQKLHHHVICKDKNCLDIPKKEKQQIKAARKKDAFQHTWLSKPYSYCNETEMWWAIYIEGEGFYCLLCRKHQTKAQQNKSEKFSVEPSVRIKSDALKEHEGRDVHTLAKQAELCNRCSYFQKEIDVISDTQKDVLFKAFMSIYWLAKEDISNRKILSLLELMENNGIDTLKYFPYRSRGSLREILLTTGQQIERNICAAVGDNYYGLLIDDVADIANIEQMLMFVQYFDSKEGEIAWKFLSVSNVLAESNTADAQTLLTVTKQQLNNHNLSLDNLRGLVTDGAAVMVGNKNGLAALLKEEVPSLVSIHCICHKLALSCVDTNKDLKVIKKVEVEVTQLWRVFDNSPKKLSVYFKVQQTMDQLILNKKAGKKVARKLKKACQTRWLSFDKAIAAVLRDLPAILQTLRALVDDPACSGLLKKFSKPKHIGTIFILNSVLPILSELSRNFQYGSVNYSRIQPSINSCKFKLQDLVDNSIPLKKFKEYITEDSHLELSATVTEKDYTCLSKLLKNYVVALKQNITKRFQSAAPVLSSLEILDPTAVPKEDSMDFKDYGLRQIAVWSNHFYPEDHLKHEKLTTEWQAFKHDLATWELPQSVTSGNVSPEEWALHHLCKSKFTYKAFPLLVSVASALHVIPVSNAWPERGASKVKLIKTRLRSLLANDTLNALMHISLNGPSTKEAKEIINQSIDVWLNKKKRRKLQPKTYGKSPILE